MSSSSIPIAGKIDPDTVGVLETVHRAATELAIPYIVVGATARDLVLHYGYGAPVRRATHDVDFAIEVPDWQAFHALKRRLEEAGFDPTASAHRLHAPNDSVVDIVPFGPIASEDEVIAWPPDENVTMNVSGFADALSGAETARVREEPTPLDIPVATPAGMAVLKLIAWTERNHDMRRKDARDLVYLLAHYEVIPHVKDRLYEPGQTEMMDGYGWDPRLGGAHLLGRDARAIASGTSGARILRLANREFGSRTPEQLTAEACERPPEQYESHYRLLEAFLNGFMEDAANTDQ